ncbi:phosphatase PAP2 family protein [Tateyamaria sp. syn59]|uniref:phosphatase PAP2 family protein n=1 Tax=Tateyamaria sp. syn59 TaxID=2576942 RepID=UPI0011BD4872|nr:phosphatase PAP2 family protein [Tateyamaria sp. syn59]
MNAALATTHDAIVGYWDGKPDTKNPFCNIPPAHDPLKSLDPTRRIDLLSAELLARFNVTGSGPEADDDPTKFKPGHATVVADHKPIFETTGPKHDVLKKQLIWLRNYADLRFDRLSEINRQLDDITSFFGAVTRLDAASRQHTLEFLSAANQVVYAIEMRVKWLTWTPRPIDLSSRVQPVIQTPDHSSFPSGHATEAFAMATLIERLTSGTSAHAAVAAQTMPFRLAHRVAVNRTVAGVHYPIDSGAGMVLGCMMGEAIWSMLQSASFNPETDAEGQDPVLNWRGNYDVPGSDELDTDFLLPRTPPDWVRNEPYHIVQGPITAAYKVVVGREW